MFANSKLYNHADLQNKPLTEKRKLVLEKRLNSDVLSKFKLLRNLLNEQDTKCWEIGVQRQWHFPLASIKSTV